VTHCAPSSAGLDFCQIGSCQEQASSHVKQTCINIDPLDLVFINFAMDVRLVVLAVLTFCC